MRLAKRGPIAQIGYVVENVDASIQRWIATTGVGPWTVFRNVVMQGVYRGAPVEIGMHVGLGYLNGVQIELIEQSNASASPYRSDAGSPLLGPHHVAWLTDNLDAAVTAAEADGLQTLFRAENPGTRVAYLTMPGEPGVRFEFIESPTTADLIKSGLAAAKDWDGSNPIHVIDFNAA